MDSFYCVIDPITASILEDIMWTSTARELCDWARGHDSIEATRNLRIHTNAHDAEQDVHARLANLADTNAPTFDLGSEIESWLSDLDEVEKFEWTRVAPLRNATQTFLTLKDGRTFGITIIEYPKP